LVLLRRVFAGLRVDCFAAELLGVVYPDAIPPPR
jgi:hypothetical protein